eukprot:CAMPEP_0119112204 /NCGR_PEP_ID=MMETSP1180-20130426/39160_1 /TAXON_ID=3052 ORGANISM="Chlamydomonas cf sp, Strain CCMP681" /NCGR_SAMPLE_ID=MMETSP1180 /ASSEMBLY_ACC=CAM_ASM_000741 /LENGTH=146 /DNA_ID=CAMNT_0007099581 /DNA_START=166 /DNA_END=607 /DNA_ORIENTATION=-
MPVKDPGECEAHTTQRTAAFLFTTPACLWPAAPDTASPDTCLLPVCCDLGRATAGAAAPVLSPVLLPGFDAPDCTPCAPLVAPTPAADAPTDAAAAPLVQFDLKLPSQMVAALWMLSCGVGQHLHVRQHLHGLLLLFYAAAVDAQA